MRNLVILSPCFYPDASRANLMLRSASAHGLNAQLYGVGLTFFAHGADAQVAKLYDYMATAKLADLVLITDCRDVLFTAGFEEIVAKFDSFGKDLVISTEQGCWPPEPEIVDFFYGRSVYGYNYVNGGQYIGTWEYVLHCLDHLLTVYRGKHPGADNSQGWWMWAKMREELDFALDSECRIFQTMSGGASEHVAISNGRVKNFVTGEMPCSVHFNGNPNTAEPHREMYKKLFE
jgi:hypothetical protein